MNALFSINQKLGSLETAGAYLNRDIRDLKAEIQVLREKDLADLRSKLDKQQEKLSSIDKRVYAAVVLLGIAGIIIGPLVTFLLGRYLK